MSRAFTLGILVVLLGLLGVMSYAVRSATAPPPPPTPEQQKAMEKQQAEQQKKMMKQEVEQRKKMMAEMKKRAAEAKKRPKAAANTGMQIESSWFNKRPSGEEGIKNADKAAEEAAKALNSAPAMSVPESAVAHPAHVDTGKPAAIKE